MNWYVNLVLAHPILTAVVQFAILGTLGEVISKWLTQKSFRFPFSLAITLWKMTVWGILAVCIKYAFVGMDGFVNSLIEHGLLPDLNTFGFAFAKSALINLQFGLFLVLFHRILDNLMVKEKHWHHLDKSMLSLLWFWIPAHTITFCLPKPFLIGLAAAWSIVLGYILGHFDD